MDIQSEIQTYLETFISFKSIEGNYNEKHACLDWIHQEFLLGQSEVVRGEVSKCPYLYLQNPDAKWLFFAHIDVVPADESMFRLQSADGKYLGRGVKDMKGAQLPFLLAYKHAIESGMTPEVSILLTSDEEIAGSTIPYLLQQKIVQADIAYTPDGAGEYFVIEHKGAIWADLRVEGKGSHAAYPWKADNPIYLLSTVLQDLQAKFPAPKEEDWSVSVTPTIIQASDTRNKISHSATCSLDIRFPGSVFADELIEAIKATLPEYCTLLVSMKTEGLCTDASHPLIQCFIETAKNHDCCSKLQKEHGSTDARYFAATGIPAFLYGPNGGGLHTPDEWVSMDSLVSHYNIYTDLLTKKP